ncbi:MAG: YtxH domain-containing protein [Weeksellaceae bacterium]
MTNNNENNSHNFWSGFALGAVAGGALMYMFATERGRKSLTSILANAESLEHNIEDVLDMLQKQDLFKDTK